jgi:hypothetical protein
MDMQICNSAQTDFSDGGYTLYRLKWETRWVYR